MASNVGPGKEFPTEWHRDAYGDACERDYDGAIQKIETAKAQLAEAEEMKKNAYAELVRIGRRKAEKRPRGKADNVETRA